MERQTVTAYPVVLDVPGATGFLQQVFGAEEKMRTVGSAGGYHAELQIGDTALMIGGGGEGVEWKGEARPMAFHIYVPDVDATYRKALDSGAASLQIPTDQEWGERTAQVRDPAGNCWYIATFGGENYFSEGAPTVQPYLQPLRGAPLIEFLEAAFGAVEEGRAEDPAGLILHTTLKVGNSALELMDAAGIYQPMPGMFFAYVGDVDAAYSRAVAAGAEAMMAPMNQDFGDRMGSVRDVAGNDWYLAGALVG